MPLLVEHSDIPKHEVCCVEGNTEYNEIYLECYVFGFMVANYSGTRSGAEEWVRWALNKYTHELKQTLDRFGYVKKNKEG